MIETERILLRKFSLDDAHAVYEFGSNKEVQQYTGDGLVTSLEMAKQIISKNSIGDYEKYGFGRLAVWHKQDQKVIGFAGLKYLPEFDEVDIGYRFLPEYWGKGIATEVSLPLITYGFEDLKLDRIIGIAMKENVASCRVLEKIGLTFYKEDYYLDEPELLNWYKIEKASYFNR